MVLANVHEAKTNLSKLMERAEAGEEVVIARNGKPAVRLVPIAQEPPARLTRREAFEALRGQVWISPDIDKVEEEIARMMNGDYDEVVEPPR